MRHDAGPLRSGAPRALIAVGDDLYRVGLARLLAEGGIAVVAQAASPWDASDAAADLRVEVALVEVLDARSGALAIARLRDRPDPPSVLALSGSPSEAEAVAALSAGASGYLHKDVDFPTLAAAIQALRAGEVMMPSYVANAVLASLRESLPPETGSELEGQPLSPRELEVLALVAQGLGNEEIARELVVATSTVKNHVTRIVDKLGARNRTHAAVLAVNRRYI